MPRAHRYPPTRTPAASLAVRASPAPLRALLLALAAVLALLASPVGASAHPARGGDRNACASGVALLGYSDALDKRTYEGTNVGGLSALAYDRARGVYYSLVDNEGATNARLYTLRIPARRSGLGAPTIRDVTTLRRRDGTLYTGADFDGEGLALPRRGGLLISSETEPSIRRFGLGGRQRDALRVPRRFRVAPAGGAVANATFESLALSPNNRALYTAVEGPLAPDGSTADGRNRIRILRYERGRDGGFRPGRQYYYRTEPGQGMVELVALSGRRLLVLERGFVPGEGNTVRIFQVSLRGAEDVRDEPTLAAPGLRPVRKRLLVDVGRCPPSGAASPGAQANPLLDNYEGLALGPRLNDGRRVLLLQSDDYFNAFNAGQVTRIVALAVRPARLSR